MKLTFNEQAWSDYLYWQKTDKKTLRRLNEILKSIKRTPFEGIGKPEPLRGNLSGWWSRRLDHEHRLIYRVEGDTIQLLQCRYHY
ncbi:MAG: Txe/YoeB family addiction module toxin [Pseudomonadota bacterium]